MCGRTTTRIGADLRHWAHGVGIWLTRHCQSTADLGDHRLNTRKRGLFEVADLTIMLANTCLAKS